MNTRKNRKFMPAASVIILCGMISMAYQNCARARFSIDPAAKSEALGKESVFGRNGGDDGVVGAGGQNTPGNDGNVPGGGGGGGGSRTPGNDMGTPKPNVPVSFSFECSNRYSEAAGGNVLTAAALKVVIVDRSNNIVCELNGDFKSQILNTKSISFVPCAGLPAGNYEAHIMDASAPSSSFLSKELTQDEIKIVKNADGSYSSSTGKIGVLYDFNQSNSSYSELNSQYGNTSTAESQAVCDRRVSPLIISMGSQARGIKLSAPLDGIQFDILGERSFPRAHDKKQISWFSESGHEYYFIVLPNSSGQVLGINEMFGDNTRGPDGKFSANGYLALAKHDDDKDSLITEDDEVYSKLRLWNDKNRDGIADSSELSSLKDKGLMVIDLNYDKRYKETDKYGNQTLMKSVAKAEDGKLHLMFDLWFRYINITK